MYFEIYEDAGNSLLTQKWRWRLISGNGKIIANSGESYHNKQDCLHAIDLVKGTGATTPVRQA